MESNNTNLTLAGPSVLNMDDISTLLKAKYNHIAHDGEGNVSSLKNVDLETINSVIPADRIALSVSNQDRSTVNNALNLGGQPADYYMSKSEGSDLNKAANTVRKEYGSDISDLRDELYQLKYALAKQGLIVNNNEHLGYHDIFRNGYKPYEYEVIGELAGTSVDNQHLYLTQDTYNALDNGDYIAIWFKDVQKLNVKQIRQKLKDGQTVVLDSAVDANCLINTDNVLLYKTYGVSRDGNFYFALDTEYKMGDTSMYTCLDDDSNFRFRRVISSEDTGYATTLRVPENKLGFLVKTEIQAKAFGSPTLCCCVIDEQDIPNFKNPEQMKAAYDAYQEDKTNMKVRFFAASKPVTLDPTLGETVYSFDFFDSSINRYPILSNLDTVNNAVRYCLIVYAVSTDASNYAEVLFLQHKNPDGTYGDLQLNNIAYTYSAQKDSSSNDSLLTNDELNQSDLYYGLTTKELIVNDLQPLDKGLYSAKIHTSYPEGISRARLTMRVNREGGRCFANIPSGDVYGIPSNNSFTVDNIDYSGKAQSLSLNSYISNPLEYRTDTDLLNAEATDEISFNNNIKKTTETIIGNNILFAQESNYDQIIPEKPIYVNPNDFVYRNAYIVAIKGKRWEYNSESQQYEVVEQKKIFLPLKAVIKDVVKPNKDIYSDRLIFESEFDIDGELKFFNDIELQIYWENNTLYSSTSEEQKLKMGIIHDLVLSFDRFV